MQKQSPLGWVRVGLRNFPMPAVLGLVTCAGVACTATLDDDLDVNEARDALRVTESLDAACADKECEALPAGKVAKVPGASVHICVKAPVPDKPKEVEAPKGNFDWRDLDAELSPDIDPRIPKIGEVEQGKVPDGCTCADCSYYCPIHGVEEEPQPHCEPAPDLKAPVKKPPPRLAAGCERVSAKLEQKAFAAGLGQCILTHKVQCKPTTCEETCRQTAHPKTQGKVTRDDSLCAKDECACVLSAMEYSCDCLCNVEL